MRPIDADKLDPEDISIWDFEDNQEMHELLREMIADQPTLDVAPVVHAHWVGHFEDDSYSAPGQFRCSLCGAMAGLKTDGNYAALTRFCPHCGAKMDGDPNG